MTLDTKKRRIVSIVVLWNQSQFQRLMLLDYQTRLDLASGMMLPTVIERAICWYHDEEIDYKRHFNSKKLIEIA
jgi:hypothetical protein